jgi:hypothetical protein
MSAEVSRKYHLTEFQIDCRYTYNSRKRVVQSVETVYCYDQNTLQSWLDRYWPPECDHYDNWQVVSLEVIPTKTLLFTPEELRQVWRKSLPTIFSRCLSADEFMEKYTHV